MLYNIAILIFVLYIFYVFYENENYSAQKLSWCNILEGNYRNGFIHWNTDPICIIESLVSSCYCSLLFINVVLIFITVH